MLLMLERSNELLRAIFLLIGLSNNAHMKCTSNIFSLIVSNLNPHFIVTLQMIPQFFTRFNFDGTHNSTLPLRPFYNIIMNMNLHSYFSISIDISLNRLLLQFWHPRNEQRVLLRRLELEHSIEEDYVDQIDLGMFVSIDSETFRRIVTKFDGYLVRVTITNSYVKFDIGTKEVILPKEESQCIIDGVLQEEKEIEFTIALHPVAFFCNVTSRSERVWFFKTINRGCMIISPMGMFAQYKVYFPNMYHGKTSL